MAGSVIPGPLGCQAVLHSDLDDGTLIRQPSSHPGPAGGSAPVPHDTPPASPHSPSTGHFPPLQLGSKGPAVRDLQILLNSRLSPSPRLNPDGVFGHLTRQAVLAFQRDQWLVDDGVVGRCTWNALRRAESGGAAPGRPVPPA